MARLIGGNFYIRFIYTLGLALVMTVALLGCGDDGSSTSVTCGSGTHLENGECVADAPDGSNASDKTDVTGSGGGTDTKTDDGSILFRAIVTDGYTKTLELMGVGYRVQEAGDGIILNVGYSHPVEIHPEEGVTMEVEGNNRVHVRGIDKQKVGSLAAKVRKVRPPNAYKEKGIASIGNITRENYRFSNLTGCKRKGLCN